MVVPTAGSFCHNQIDCGLFTDQRWVDLAPAFFEGLKILRDPGYNVATWNLTHRTVAGSLESGLTVNGRPLCFFHFSGFDSGRQKVMLDKFGGRSPVLHQLRAVVRRPVPAQWARRAGRISWASSVSTTASRSRRSTASYTARARLAASLPRSRLEPATPGNRISIGFAGRDRAGPRTCCRWRSRCSGSRGS